MKSASTIRNKSSMCKRLSLMTLAVAICCSNSVTLAHHPIQAKFEASTPVSFTGVVTNVDWSNPHTHVFVNVTADGATTNWAIELESPIQLGASGWSRDTVKPGDTISVEGIRARDGSRQLWAESVELDGKAVLALKDTAPPIPANKKAAPRWPDGTLALGATNSTDGGYWGYPSSTALVEDGVSVEMDKYGQLANLADASKVAPLQPWALGVYQHRQERNFQEDPLFINCKPPGGPRQYQSDLGIKFVEDKPNQRIFVTMGSGNHNFRIIYMDGRAQTGLVTGDDNNPLYYGRAAGHWEGDTLVVNTTGFNEDFWFTNGGLPHTSLLTLNEKFSRPDLDTLHYEVTVEDLGAYTRPWTASWDMRWVAGKELPVHFCQDNRP
ncbi:MAG: DUF6152 family protein [Pseudomonadota bacterium]